MIIGRALAQRLRVARLDARARRELGRRGEAALLDEDRLDVLVRRCDRQLPLATLISPA